MRRLATTGDLTDIIRIDKKLNDLYSRIHLMAQNEIERPMIADTNTFKTPRAWMKMSGQATSVIVKRQGTDFMRLPPTEIPQFVFVYIEKLEQALERVMAVAGIMRGQLTEGSQLSSETVSSLQGMATAVLKMKAEEIAEFMKVLGYQLNWLIRDAYPENITVDIQLPDGTKKQVQWDDNNAADDYVVDIESGSGLPGHADPSINMVLPLFREGLIDRPAALQMLRKLIPDWQQVASRMEQDKLKKIEAAAAGHAEGIEIKKFEKERETAGGASKV